MSSELSTPKTRASLAERLRAITVSMQMTPGGDATTAKFVFDLKACAGALDDLDRLLELILVEMAAATNRDLATDGDVGDEEGVVWKQIEDFANEVRKRLDMANPEPKVV